MKKQKKKREAVSQQQAQAAVESEKLTKHPGGRPTKFTPETRQRILEALRASGSYKAAADYARISYDCLRDWIKSGQETEGGEFFKFSQDVKEALGHLQVRSLASIQKTGLGGILIKKETTVRKDGTEITAEIYSQPQWQALAWIMRNRFWQEWGEKVEMPDDMFEGDRKPLMTLKRETIDIYD